MRRLPLTQIGTAALMRGSLAAMSLPSIPLKRDSRAVFRWQPNDVWFGALSWFDLWARRKTSADGDCDQGPQFDELITRFSVSEPALPRIGDVIRKKDQLLKIDTVRFQYAQT